MIFGKIISNLTRILLYFNKASRKRSVTSSRFDFYRPILYIFCIPLPLGTPR
jgi:hypothetical protein